MIRLCTCTVGSDSSSDRWKLGEYSDTCRGCGGKLSADERGELPGSMLSTVGLDLNWKTASKGRQRAVRRARTSFTGNNEKKTTTKSSKVTNDLIDGVTKRTRSMPVSESNKIGVSNLGRHFNDDNIASVPIKKRRFLFVRPPSPPPASSSQSEDSEESQPALYEEDASNAKNSGMNMESDHKKSCADERILEGINEKLCDAVDFSGISILAAVACDSNIEDEIANTDYSVSKGCSSKGEYRRLCEEDQIHPNEYLGAKIDIPSGVSTTPVLPGKESDGNELDKSSLENIPNKANVTESSSRDAKFQWDLNTVMDVWENHSDAIPNSEPLAASITSEDGLVGENMGNVESQQFQIGYSNKRYTSCQSGGDVKGSKCTLQEAEVQEKSVYTSDNSLLEPHSKSFCVWSPTGDGPVQEERGLENTSVDMVDSSKETESLHNLEEGTVNARHVSFPIRCAFVSSDVSEEEKSDGHPVGFGSIVGNEISIPLLTSENQRVDHASNTPELHVVLDQVTEVTCEDKTLPPPVGDPDDCLDDCCETNVLMGNLRSHQGENHASLCTDTRNGKTDRCSLACHIPGIVSDVMITGTFCADMNTGGALGGSAHADVLNDIDWVSADNVKEVSRNPFPSFSSCTGEHETADASMNIQHNNSSVLTDENLNITKADNPVHIDNGALICRSAGMNPGTVDVQHIDVALNSHGVCRSDTDGYVSSPGQVALEDHFDCDYYSDASQPDTDQPTGAEKAVFLRDDDYQYEDGEFIANSWGEYRGEDADTEHVDYGSDNRETDIMEVSSDIPASAHLHVNSEECKSQSYANPDKVGNETQHAVSQPLSKCSPILDVLDAGSVNRCLKDGNNGLERDNKDALDSGAARDKSKGDRDVLPEFDVAKEFGRFDSIRMKSSGWDLLPDSCRSSGVEFREPGVDPICSNQTGVSLDTPFAGESSKRVVGSSLEKDMPTRIDRLNSFDMSYRRDKSYIRASRSDDINNLGSRVERNISTPQSIGRGGSSRHMQSQGRRGQLVDSPNHCGSNRHDSRGYYGSTSLTHPASRNATAAAVAKMESNGFIVAPDGTIIKAGATGLVPDRSAKASSHSTRPSHMVRRSSVERSGSRGEVDSTRELSPDRHTSIVRGRTGRSNSGMGSRGHSERYRGLMHDENLTTSLPLHHTRREQSFSPHRRLHYQSQSRTRSPSRSRTRSPRMLLSPRGRNGSGMNGCSGLRRRSRSPNYKSEVRTQRRRSPQHQSYFVQRVADYVTLSRTHTSPPHASRWVDERKGIANNLREIEHNQCSERSPPRRVFSRSRRLDPVDFPGRIKSGEYYRSIHSGSFPEPVDFDRASRHDGSCDDRRAYANRYEMLHPVRESDTDGNMAHFNYGVDDSSVAHNYRTRSSEFQRRCSPRGFGRCSENQLGDSHVGAKEEKVHLRYDRDGKHYGGFKSFGTRDFGDGMTSQRRPS